MTNTVIKMPMRPLGSSGLNVSLICLGTMTWGEQNTQDEAFEQLDYAVEHGINFLDTAEMYPVPPMAETQGRTEEIIGNWLEARKNRDQVIVATKVVGPTAMTYIRPHPKLNRENMMQALENSLRRLKTDYVDLYQLHWPDREVNFFGQLNYKYNPDDNPVPIEETLGVLKEMIDAGKVRYVGVSNETPWGVMKFMEAAKYHNLPRIHSIQNPYSLLNRSFEVGLSEVAIQEQCGLLAYSPLAFGKLSGKYLEGKSGRITQFARFNRYSNVEADEATKLYVALAKQAGLTPTQLALGFVNAQPFVTSNIIGATTMAQLKENIETIHVKLSPDVLREIEVISQKYSNPCP